MPFVDKPESRREVGMRIKQARLEAGGMSQRELAELVGVTESTIQSYEQGRSIGHRFMRQIAEVTGTTVAWLYNGEEATTDRDVLLAEINANLKSLSRRVDAILKAVRQ